FHTDWRAHHAAPGSLFGPWFSSDEPFDSVVVRLHPAAERTRMLLAMASSVLRPGGSLTLVGHNDAGIRSAGKFLDDARVLDARFHCRALTTVVSSPASSSPAGWRTTYTFEDLTVV